MNLKKNDEKLSVAALAVPILLESVLRSALGTVNVFLLGRYSDEAVAAVGTANQFMSIILMACTMIATGTAVIINQSLGAGRKEESNRIAMNALTVACALGAAISAALAIWGGELMRAVGLSGQVLADATTYITVVGASSLFLSASTMLSNVFRCCGDARTPMLVVLACNALNVLGVWITLYEPFGAIPGLEGVAGVSWVRFSVEVFGAVALCLLLARSGRRFRITDMLRVRARDLGRILKLGCLSGIEGISYSLGQFITISFISALGVAAISAKTYVQNIDYYAYVIGLSIGQATQIIAGHMIGAGDLDGAKRRVRRTWVKVCAANTACGLLLYIFAEQVIGIFTSDPAVISVARTLLLIDIFVQFSRSFNHSFNFGLRSAGFIAIPAAIAACSIWLLNVGGAWFFSVVCSLGAAGIWIGMALDEITRGLCACVFWNTGVWKKGALRMISADSQGEKQLNH